MEEAATREKREMVAINVCLIVTCILIATGLIFLGLHLAARPRTSE